MKYEVLIAIPKCAAYTQGGGRYHFWTSLAQLFNGTAQLIMAWTNRGWFWDRSVKSSVFSAGFQNVFQIHKFAIGTLADSLIDCLILIRQSIMLYGIHII